MNVFEARNVNKRYSDKYALNNVSVSVPQGLVCGLLGPNGAGKTTLLRIINHITSIDSGELFFKNNKMRESDLANIGYLPEERGLYKKMKVGEQLLYLARIKGLSKNDALSRLKNRFEQFEIMPWWSKTVEELSKGMQQKIQFINTIVQEPDFLIFDEPFSGFDPINANIFKKEILSLKEKGTSILLSTHDMSSVEEMCDNISLINNSEIILGGELSSVRESYKSNIFNIEIRGGIEKASDLNKSYKITDVKDLQNKTSFKIQADNADKLLNDLINNVKLVSFVEELPGMKEIFIQAVKEKELVS